MPSRNRRPALVTCDWHHGPAPPFQEHHRCMNHHISVVVDYLQSDPAVFVNTECSIQLDEAADPGKPGRHCCCDAVAIDLRHGAVYLCQTAFERKLQPLIQKLSVWTRNWDVIGTALRRDSKAPASWRIHVWLFVPKDSIEMLDGKLEHLRRTIGSKFKVKITALEDVQPWRASCWNRSEEAWETIGLRNRLGSASSLNFPSGNANS